MFNWRREESYFAFEMTNSVSSIAKTTAVMVTALGSQTVCIAIAKIPRDTKKSNPLKYISAALTHHIRRGNENMWCSIIVLGSNYFFSLTTNFKKDILLRLILVLFEQACQTFINGVPIRRWTQLVGEERNCNQLTYLYIVLLERK